MKQVSDFNGQRMYPQLLISNKGCERNNESRN